MAEVHHFTYGVFNPIAAYLLAFLGSFFGLLCTERARAARNTGRRTRWLVLAAFAIGGGAIWLMHFAAMLGFDVPASPVRYSVPMTGLSFVYAVVTVGIGLMIVGHGKRSLPKTIAAGVFTGGGVLAMHYTGMEGVHVSGHMSYNLTLVAASAVIAVVAATAALWFATSVQGWGRISGAAAIMGVAVCGMHYTGMAAMSVHLTPAPPGGVTGLRPLTMIVPITLFSAATIVGVALSALQAMTEEEFTDGEGTPRRGAHAEQNAAWALKQPTIPVPLPGSSTRRMTGLRPSPRPIPMRSPGTPTSTGTAADR